MDEMKTSDRIAALQQQKARAVAVEDYDEAQRLKEEIAALRGDHDDETKMDAPSSPSRSKAMEMALVAFLVDGPRRRKTSAQGGGSAALHLRQPIWHGQDTAAATPHSPAASFGTPPKPPARQHRGAAAERFTAAGCAAEYEGVNSKLGYKWDRASPSRRAPAHSFSSPSTKSRRVSEFDDDTDASTYTARGVASEYSGENAKLKLGWQGDSRKTTTVRNVHAFDHPKTKSRRSIEDKEAEAFTSQGKGARSRILQITVLDWLNWAPCFSQRWPGFSFPRID